MGAIGTYVILRTITPRVDDQPVPPSTTPPNAINERRIHVAAMGDMLAHDTIIKNAKTSTGYDFSQYFAAIRPSYAEADVVFCNQEGLSSGEAYGISGYPSFNAPTQFAADLRHGAGCNMINLANNHMGDKGIDATNATVDVWRALNPLVLSGANKSVEDQGDVSYGVVDGVRIGFVSFADFNNNTATPGYSVNNYHDEALVRRLVGEARAAADVVIVSMHWGVEDSSVVSEDQRQATTLLGSLGVDVVIGSGPHVLQKTETIVRTDGGRMVVWYSLGNMLSSQFDIKELIGGIAQFDIVMSNDQKVVIENLRFQPTYMHYEWTAEEKARDDVSARRNAKLYLLKDAAAPLSRSLFSTTVEAQRQYVIDTLGQGVVVK
jgi:poly-gamma-glutamate synthesis protein (capsule biosynthesis protein)